MTLRDLRMVKKELQELKAELRKTQNPQLRLDILERFKKITMFLKQGT